jgi:colanic acid biosynthesis glycosyl transferase WcaI
MRVGIVSQYYAPETGATQNRMAAFTAGLIERGHEVVVICEQPNHPTGVYQPGWGRRAMVTERSGALTTHRLWVAASPRKTTGRRLAFYGTFAAGAFATALAVSRPDVMLISSPPLPGAWAAGMAARARRIPFVLDVRDLWPAAAVALEELSGPRLLRFLEAGERWLYGTAAAVTATTGPFCRYIDSVAGRAIAVHLPNGALDSLLAIPESSPATEGFVVGYAGNFGIAQGLGIALDAAELLRDEPAISFRLVGAGPLAAELELDRERRGLVNLTIEPSLPVEHVGQFLQSCHALLIPLRAHPLLNDFVPSKLYDAMAVGRPALVAAGREAAALVEETGCGVVVPPEDALALAAAVRALAADRSLAEKLGTAGRRAAPQHARSSQVGRLAEVLRTAAEKRQEV